MKNWRFLLLVPLIVGVIYLRSLASWRPQKVFVGTEAVSQLVFSDDGRTLLVAQGLSGAPSLTALDVAHGLGVKWTRQGDLDAPQFFAADTRIAAGVSWQTFNAATGAKLGNLHGVGDCLLSPDGHWLVDTIDWHLIRLHFITTGPSSTSTGAQEATNDILNPNHTLSGRVFTPDSKRLIVAASDAKGSRLDVYDVQTGHRIQSWPDMQWDSSLRESGGATLMWSADRQFVLAFWTASRSPLPDSNSVSVWRVRDHHRIASLRLPDTCESCSVARRSLAVATGDRALVLESLDGSSWEYANQVQFTSKKWFRLPSETLLDSTLSPDGSLLYLATESGHVYQQRLK